MPWQRGRGRRRMSTRVALEGGQILVDGEPRFVRAAD
jgi:hypothetical protein